MIINNLIALRLIWQTSCGKTTMAGALNKKMLSK